VKAKNRFAWLDGPHDVRSAFRWKGVPAVAHRETPFKTVRFPIPGGNRECQASGRLLILFEVRIVEIPLVVDVSKARCQADGFTRFGRHDFSFQNFVQEVQTIARF
jgi:hypothetical protein